MISDSHGATRSNFWADALAAHGHRTALIDEARVEVSYSELAERADAFAALIGSERRLVLLEGRNDVASVVALLGCLRGGHPVILSSAGGADQIAQTFRPAVTVRGDVLDWAAVDMPCTLHPDLALMLSTSGSTGATKLVRLSHRAIQANAASIADYLAIGEEDRALTTLPISYSYGLSVLNSHLLAGGSIVLTDRSVIDDALWELFRDTGTTGIAGVPYTYELLEARGFRDGDLATLRTMTQAGGRLSPDLVRTYHDWARDVGVRFFTMYGQTEATARMAYMPPDQLGAHPDHIGRPVPGGRIRLVDESGHEVARGSTGELAYSGDNVMMGYAFARDDLAGGHDLTELRTGDLARQGEHGLYRIVGRSSRFSKIAGLRVSLDEIETILTSHGIAATVAGDDLLVAIAVTDTDRVDEAERIVGDRVAIPARARAVFAAGELPRLPSGKVDYSALLACGRAAQASADAVRAEIGGKTLNAAYASALNRRDVGDDDSFASLGGDSLAYIQVSMAIDQELGQLPDHWEQLTLRELRTLASASPPSRRGNVRSVAGEMVIRPLAISFIVAGHTVLWGGGNDAAYKGGAMALLLAAGYNSSRFQRDKLISDDRWQLLGQFFARVVIPYYILLVIEHILPHADVLSPSKIALLGSYFPPDGAQVRRYWFIEAMFQMLLILVLLFSMATFRRAAVTHRWWVGLALVAVAAVFKFGIPAIASPDFLDRAPYRLDVWAYVFAIGWLVADAHTMPRKLFCLVLGFVLCGLDWGIVESHNAMLMAAMALIMFVPRFSLWTPAARFLAFFAQSTFYIYLSNNLTFSIVTNKLNVHNPIALLFACIAVGMMAFVSWRIVEQWFVARIHRWRDLPQHSMTDL